MLRGVLLIDGTHVFMKSKLMSLTPKGLKKLYLFLSTAFKQSVVRFFLSLSLSSLSLSLSISLSMYIYGDRSLHPRSFHFKWPGMKWHIYIYVCVCLFVRGTLKTWWPSWKRFAFITKCNEFKSRWKLNFFFGIFCIYLLLYIRFWVNLAFMDVWS